MLVVGETNGHSGDIAVNFRMFFAVQFAEGSVDLQEAEIRTGANANNNNTEADATTTSLCEITPC